MQRRGYLSQEVFVDHLVQWCTKPGRPLLKAANLLDIFAAVEVMNAKNFAEVRQ